MDTNKLKELGFVQVDFLSKEKRDGMQRMTWTGYIDGSIVTVRIINDIGKWKIDHFIVENNDSGELLSKYKNDENFLSYVIDSIRSNIA